MTLGKVVFYDYDHCQEFLEDHARQLRETTQGLKALALYRELFHGFTYEALESSAITLGQFDGGLIYIFIPEMLSREYFPDGHKVSREKAIELLGSDDPPMVFELKAAYAREPSLHKNACYTNWMKPELVTLVHSSGIEIQLYFNGSGFFSQILVPTLEQQGYSVADSYLDAAKSSYVRARHPDAPGKVFKLPWVRWIREMMTGAYSMAYIMACMGNYIIKMNESLPGNNTKTQNI